MEHSAGDFLAEIAKKIALAANGHKVEGGFVQVIGLLDGEAVVSLLSPEKRPIALEALKSRDVPKGALVYGVKPLLGLEVNVQELCTILVSLSKVRRHVPIPDAPWNRGKETK